MRPRPPPPPPPLLWRLLPTHPPAPPARPQVGNIGHFDNEIDMAGLYAIPGIKRQNIKPQVRRAVLRCAVL